MPIREMFDEEAVLRSIAVALDEFYETLISKVDKLSIRSIMRRKNPYLFRAKAMNDASQIVEAILAAFISSSEETIFGNVFFEPVAAAAVGGVKAVAEGIDLAVYNEDTIFAVAVKSGPNVFNADSKKKQEQNFTAAAKLAQQAKKRFVPIIGYGYGRKKPTGKGLPKIYIELAGQAFWKELTGDDQFYVKLIRLMDGLPEQYVDKFNVAYQKASNRLVREFTNEFCLEDGSIDWEKIVVHNSGSQTEITEPG